jgi:hypothetical protein
MCISTHRVKLIPEINYDMRVGINHNFPPAKKRFGKQQQMALILKPCGALNTQLWDGIKYLTVYSKAIM